ncbi:MAG TPA: immunoglobulin domain-containing protein [Anaerohalosphaeraceae bacterium]|nr:immunoglobulin domain-containing protein [Anaerohalosphaeraceae bacterium]HOL88436.1 immunoglobulin domain-containing protein [Anaerohalosphaeraceae bacterium]HPP57420.1 immunoglobulin domain-containing protein [Anaerohalosphaeraceae bacterium]
MMKKITCFAGILSILSSLSWGLTLTNPGFDAQTISDGAWSAPAAITGWDLNGGWSHAQNLAADAITPEAQSGANTCGLNGVDGTDGGAYISQIVKEDDGTTPVLVQADKIYKVTVWVGRRTGVQGSFPGILKVYLQETSGAAPTNIAEATYDLAAQGQNTWTRQTLYLSTGPAPAGLGSPLRLMLRNVGNRSSTHWYQQVVLDDVAISEPYIAAGPSPAHGETNVPVTVNLSWSAPEAFTPLSYNVYLGKDPNVSQFAALGITGTSVDPSPSGNLAFGTTYYWRVDAVDPNNGSPIVRKGNIWRFTTVPEEVVVQTNPVGQTVSAGSNVTFTAEFLNASSYAWYKSNDAAVSVDDQNLGVNSNTLTLSNVQLGDEGWYYCIGSNSKPSSAVSGMARLMTRRLVGWWKLDGNLNDSVQEVISGVPTHNGIAADPNFTAGLSGSGCQFFGDGQTVVIQNSGDYFNFYPQGMTANVWVKTQTTTWDGILSKQYRVDNTSANWIGWVLDISNNPNQPHFTVRRAHGDLFGPVAVKDGGWHMLTAVMDPQTQTSRIYVDGLLRATSAAYNMNALTLTQEMLTIGAETASGTVGSFTGIVDDVRIWNYALTNNAIAKLYTDLYSAVEPGIELCPVRPTFDISGPQGTPDCRVNLYDLAVAAAAWLECNAVPSCVAELP